MNNINEFDRDSDIVSLYAISKKESPSEMVDARILRVSRQNLKKQRRVSAVFGSKYQYLSVAATVLLAIAIVPSLFKNEFQSDYPQIESAVDTDSTKNESSFAEATIVPPNSASSPSPSPSPSPSLSVVGDIEPSQIKPHLNKSINHNRLSEKKQKFQISVGSTCKENKATLEDSAAITQELEPRLTNARVEESQQNQSTVEASRKQRLIIEQGEKREGSLINAELENRISYIQRLAENGKIEDAKRELNHLKEKYPDIILGLELQAMLKEE